MVKFYDQHGKKTIPGRGVFVPVADYSALLAELVEVKRERDLWEHQHRLDTNLLKEINRGHLSHVDALTAQLKDSKAKVAEYEAAILRMYFRIHNSQGDLQTALEWSKI